jgi:nucleoside-diphosphate-sugar epimerase
VAFDASPYRGQRVLVTGASGFIGCWVARGLAQAGAEVWLAGRDAAALEAVCARYGIVGTVCLADLSREGEFAQLWKETRPAVVFNLAGYGIDREEKDDALAEALNTRLVNEILRTLAANHSTDWPGLRLVHTGSAFEYGAVEGTVNEDTPATPVATYGRTKLAATQQVAAAAAGGVRAATARLFTVYGPGEHANRLLPSLLRAAQTGEALPMTGGKQQRDFTHVEEVAEGLLRMGLQRDPVGTVNLATGRLTSIREFAETAAELLGLREGQLQLGALPYRGDETQQGPTDVTRLKKLLFWKPALTVREGIEKTIEFERAHPPRHPS